MVSPLARIAINTLRAGQPVVLPAGNDGIDGIVKRHWTGARPRGRAKMVKGLGLPATIHQRHERLHVHLVKYP